MKKEIMLKANYKITKISNNILAKIYCEIKNLSFITSGKKILSNIAKKDKNTILFLSKILKWYNWKYKRFLVIKEGHNLIPNVYRNEIAKYIAGVTTSATLEANYIAVGDDSTTADITDTTLWNEVLRGLFTTKDSTNNIAYLDKFFGSAEVWGLSLKEIGVFADGTATANSGYLLSKVNINEDISVNETLTINVSITLTSAT